MTDGTTKTGKLIGKVNEMLNVGIGRIDSIMTHGQNAELLTKTGTKKNGADLTGSRRKGANRKKGKNAIALKRENDSGKTKRNIGSKKKNGRWKKPTMKTMNLYLKSLNWNSRSLKMNDLYSIQDGILKRNLRDYEFRQAIKYAFFFAVGLGSADVLEGISHAPWLGMGLIVAGILGVLWWVGRRWV